jgi:hypothetical protein
MISEKIKLKGVTGTLPGRPNQISELLFIIYSESRKKKKRKKSEMEVSNENVGSFLM